MSVSNFDASSQDCLCCPEGKMCCVLTSDEFADFVLLDFESQELIARLISAGNGYEAAKRKVIKAALRQ